MRKTTSEKPQGIHWTSLSHLENLGCAADLAVISTSHTELQEKTDILDSYAKQTGFNISTTKTQVIYINAAPIVPITVNGVEDLTYLGSIISKDNDTKNVFK